MAKKKLNTNQIDIKNKKAYFSYFIDATYDAGIMLLGTEIKSLRSGKANLVDAFCQFKSDSELFVKKMYIAPYDKGVHTNHEPYRSRKLLLKKSELKKLASKVKEKGFTIVPTKLYINEKGLAKLEIGLARGKKSFDKRNTIKDKDQAREFDRQKSIKY